MKLSKLLEKVKVLNSYDDKEIYSITDDSRKSGPEGGYVFVCIHGNTFDGHGYAEEMLAKGAAAVVVERDLHIQNQIIVENTRKAFSLMCAAYFGYPADKLKLIGITGTNGKTTTAFLIKGMLDRLCVKSGMIGTVKHMIGDEELDAGNTTPEAFRLHELFAKMLDAGCEYCVMEVSSQALAQWRVEGCYFDAAIFTNLTQDHLDYHLSLENYKRAKAMLFKNAGLAVVNMDDASYPDMLKDSRCRVATYSTSRDDAAYVAKNLKLCATYSEYELLGNAVIGRVHLGIPGEFSVYNSMAAIVTLVELGFDFHSCRKAISKLPGVNGRIEPVPTGTDYSVIIDYAHTPDALENILITLKNIARARVITVFGCGGDRDRTKRPLMGAVAEKLSDYVIVTSDNPRGEDPMAIINDINEGIPKDSAKPVILEPDRTRAIRHALNEAKTDDIILLAGKGQETYQILATGKIHFDEREKVKEILGNN